MHKIALHQLLVTNKRGLVPASNPMLTLFDREIDAAARVYIQKSNAMGLAVGVLSNDQISTYGYGETRKGNRQIPNAQSIFEIASITKTFTATLLAWFVLNGKLDITDPVTHYLPPDIAANQALRQIQLVHLSNHTSGLPRLPRNFLLHCKNPAQPIQVL